MHTRRGLTLVELMVTLVLIAIVVAIATPSLGSLRLASANSSAALSIRSLIETSVKTKRTVQHHFSGDSGSTDVMALPDGRVFKARTLESKTP